MATHSKWYPSNEEEVVPYNATYSFPAQANKSVKIVPRIAPKNGSTFLPGNTIRIEFPAQGYMNPINSTLNFDVSLQGYGTAGVAVVRFQNKYVIFHTNKLVSNLFSPVHVYYTDLQLLKILLIIMLLFEL